MSFIEEFEDLFKCRKDAFSIAFDNDGKMAYPPARDSEGNDLELTEEHLMKHLKGELFLGVYPLYDTEYVSWAALDFDGGDGFAEDPISKAFEQKRVFMENGITSYVEISQSGKGAHLWIFVETPIKASDIRSLVHDLIIDAETYDRMFPNQNSAAGGYGNLIALPYHGKRFKEGKSTFVDDDLNPINPREFVSSVVKNRQLFLSSMVKHSPKSVSDANLGFENGGGDRKRNSLSGSAKVINFCKWMQAARERMPNQNQEPEFYALCCQFAQLEDGKRLAVEYGRLHPYSDERIIQKFEQAVRANKPHTCATLREEFNAECTCDRDYGVSHCYELAEKSFQELLSSQKGKPRSWNEVSEKLVERTKRVYKTGGEKGYSYGYDPLDDRTSLRNGNLIVVGARSGVGKTSWCIDVTANLSHGQGIPTYWQSLEMTNQELGMKLLGRMADVDSRSILEGTLDKQDWLKILRFQKEDKKVPIYIDDATRDIDRMMDVLSQLIHENGKGVVFIDYIELVSMRSGEDMTRMAARVVLEAKGMAKVFDVPVVLITNFNRKAEQDMVDGTDPQDSWIRNSGLVEQTADVIIYILGKKAKGITKRTLHIMKERFTGMNNEQVFLWFDQAKSRFTVNNPTNRNDRITIDRGTRSSIEAKADSNTNLDFI